MKKFFLFLVILIAVVSVGLTAYYFSIDNESIYIKSSYLIVNKGDYIRTDDENNALLEIKNRSEQTTISYIAKDSDILSYSKEGNYFHANAGGDTEIIITTNNRSYSRLVVNVSVCDGSEQNPYIIRTEEELNSIRKQEHDYSEEKNNNELCYKLGNDIDLENEWTPISAYYGIFDGNFYTINNMKISGDYDKAGFIGLLGSNGCIKNLFLTEVDYDVNASYVGAYAGQSFGIIQTSEATGSMKNVGSSSFTGGIAGGIKSNTNIAKIDRCGFEGDLTIQNASQIGGGVAGENNGGVISESYSRLNLEKGSSYFGGIVGKNESSSSNTSNIFDCYFYLKEDSDTYNNLFGIAYINNSENVVTGNYHGGIYENGQIDSFGEQTGVISNKYPNNYLTSKLNQSSSVQFGQESSFISIKSNKAGKENRMWNFDTVWEMSIQNKYPILNLYGTAGSIYVIDKEDLPKGDEIDTAEGLYLALKNNDKDYTIISDIDLAGFDWGSAEHPIPEQFDHTLTSEIDELTEKPYKITNLTILNTVEKQNVGMVQILGSSAIFNNIYISGVKIGSTSNNGNKEANFVGVLAGISNGAYVSNVIIENVEVKISGEAFGTFFGLAEDCSGNGLKDIKVNDVKTCEYYNYAGGVVGINLTTITTDSNTNPNDIYNINLKAINLGGIAGANGGTIQNTSAYDVILDGSDNPTLLYNLYEYKKDICKNIFIGGIAGLNECTYNNDTYKGNIVDTHSKLVVKNVNTHMKFNVLAGGVTAYNSGVVYRSYAKNSSISIKGSNSVFVGGLVAYNLGTIANCVVKDGNIETNIVASVGASDDYILNTDNCSIVGGLVGYDKATSNNGASISQCACYIKSIKGYYAGGLVGISFGKISFSYCGDSTKTNGGVSITGYMAGGLCSIIAGGYMTHCYTHCALNGVETGNKYENYLSSLTMKVSCMAGISVFVFNSDTIVQCCYCICSFGNNGVSYATSSDKGADGKVNCCAYQNEGRISTKLGTKISEANFKNSANSSFSTATGGSKYLQYWNIENGKYPTLSYFKLPSDFQSSYTN